MTRSQAKSSFVLLALWFWICILAGPSLLAQDYEKMFMDRWVQMGREQKQFQKKISAAEKAVETAKRIWGPEAPATASALDNLGLPLYQSGNYAKAESAYQEALRIRQKVLGPDDLETARSLDRLAVVYTYIGEYAKAEPIVQEALRIRQKVLGPENPDTLTNAKILAAMHEKIKTQPPDEATLEEDGARLRHERAAAASHDDLGTLYDSMDDNWVQRDPSTPATEKFHSLCQQVKGLYNQGKYQEAITIAERALDVAKHAWGSESFQTRIALGNLGRLLSIVGDYAKAEPVLQEASRVELVIFRHDIDPSTSDGFSGLAQLYDSIGEYAKAKPLFQKALRLRQLAFGDEDPDTASALCNLGKLYMDMREYANAEPLCVGALRIFRNILGSDNPYTAQGARILANLYEELGEYTKAEPLYQEALQIRQKLLGSDHPDTAISLVELGTLYDSIGKCAEAEPLLRQSLPILQNAFGVEHQATTDACGSLAMVEFDLGRIDKATALARQEAAARLAILTKICAFGSEEQRLSYFDRFLPYGIFPQLPGAETDLATAVLRYKGVVLDSMIEDRQQVDSSRTTQGEELVKKLNLDKTELNQLNLEEVLATRNLRIQQLEDEIAKIEGEFAQQSAGGGRARAALSVTVEQVQSVIPDDCALVEYLRYPFYLGERKWEQHYGALVLLSKGAPLWIPLGRADGIEKLVRQYESLVREPTDEAELSRSLEALHEALWAPVSLVLPNQTKRLIISPDGQLNFISFATLLNRNQQFLTERYDIQYVASGRDLLRETKSVDSQEVVLFANPDFDLPSTGTLTKKITYADLVALNRKVFSKSRSKKNAALTAKEAMIVANMKLAMSEVYPSPETEKTGTTVATQSKQETVNKAADLTTRGEERDVEGWRFESLQGTKIEDTELARKFVSWGWKPSNFTDREATKEALLKIRSPYILHLATHGFFDKEDPTTQNDKVSTGKNTVTRSNFFKNPMHRGGLALAGAQTTIEAWKREEVPPVQNDGILTAEEVSTLDLQGTWLVTLSACDTGSGEARAGEGVMGLRRGFVEAGTQYLLMTLWPISDAVTVQIMSDFYEAAHNSRNASEALAEVQRNWLVKLRSEKGLAQAVNLAGPFIMSSQGKP